MPFRAKISRNLAEVCVPLIDLAHEGLPVRRDQVVLLLVCHCAEQLTAGKHRHHDRVPNRADFLITDLGRHRLEVAEQVALDHPVKHV